MYVYVFFNRCAFHTTHRLFFFYTNIWSSALSLQTKQRSTPLRINIDVVTQTYRNVIHTYVDHLAPFDKYRQIFLAGKTKSTDSTSTNLYTTIYDSTDVPRSDIVKSWRTYYKCRYGVGNGLVRLFEIYTGLSTNNFLNLDSFSASCYRLDFKYFFLKHQFQFDSFKLNSVFYSYYQHKSIFTFKGWCFYNNYPVNGQRRRSNYRTTRTGFSKTKFKVSRSNNI